MDLETSDDHHMVSLINSKEKRIEKIGYIQFWKGEKNLKSSTVSVQELKLYCFRMSERQFEILF